MAQLTARAKQAIFWILFAAILAVSAWVLYKVLAQEVFDYILWQKLVEDPDHRHKPHEADDINADGIRSAREASEFGADSFNVIFLGDSYTYGYQLSADQAPPMQFEMLASRKLPGHSIRVANFGWSSSSPYLSLRLLKDIGRKYQPDLVILVLDVTDYKDDFFYSGVIEKRGAYRFIVDHPVLAHPVRKIARLTDAHTGWQQRLLGYPDSSTYFLFHQPYEQSVPFFEQTYANILDINEYTTNELGARLVVFVPPRHWQYTDRESPQSWEKHNYEAMGPHVLNNFTYFQQKSATAPFPVIPLLEDFKTSTAFPTTFEKDSHWNARGANLAAEFMLNHCLELKCFD